jgi:hypothetical protein
MGYNVDLLDGIANLIASAGVGTYRPTGAYQPNETAITIGVTPDRPDRNITLTTYPVEDTDLTTVITGLQCRIRAGRDPRDAEGIADDLYDLLHNKRHYRLGAIPVELSWRQSATWLGQDSDQRMERVENFYFRAERAAPNQIA